MINILIICQEAMDHWEQFLLWTINEDINTPKRHLVSHGLHTMSMFGNMRYTATWMDESLNKLLKKTCRAISQRTFESSVLWRMRENLKRIAPRADS